MILEGEIKDAKMSSFLSDFQTLPCIFFMNCWWVWERYILSFFVQIKSQLKQEDEQGMILFNNNEILIDANLSLSGNGL